MIPSYTSTLVSYQDVFFKKKIQIILYFSNIKLQWGQPSYRFEYMFDFGLACCLDLTDVSCYIVFKTYFKCDLCNKL